MNFVIYTLFHAHKRNKKSISKLPCENFEGLIFKIFYIFSLNFKPSKMFPNISQTKTE